MTLRRRKRLQKKTHFIREIKFKKSGTKDTSINEQANINASLEKTMTEQIDDNVDLINHGKKNGKYTIFKPKIHITKKFVTIILLILMLTTYVLSRPIWVNAFRLNLVDMKVDDRDSFFIFNDESLNKDINESISKEVKWQNQCLISFHYRFYMSDLKGDLSDYIVLRIQNQDQEMIYNGLMKDLNQRTAIYSIQSMKYLQRETYIFTISLSEDYEMNDNTIGNLSFRLRYEVSIVK